MAKTPPFIIDNSLIVCRRKKKEKAALDAKCKKITNLMNDSTKKRMELLEKENHLVILLFHLGIIEM